MDEITITLPLPPKEVHPNYRVHWASKAKHTKGYRWLAWYAARAQVEPTHIPWERAQTEAVFHYPTAHVRDGDGAASSLKAAWDGIADAGVIANDAGFTHLPPRLLVDRENPRVVVTIRSLP
jgi:crossover junction endodeoxyribonuclease RusA